MTRQIELKVERNPEDPTFEDMGVVSPELVVTPAIGPDYWVYRVMLTETQAVLGFWKFGMIGVGFAVEEDWNTNLPHSQEFDLLFNHIKHNKGDDRIPDEDVIEAIRLIDQAVREDGNCGCKTCVEE